MDPQPEKNSDPQFTNDREMVAWLIARLACPENECICEYDTADHLVFLHIRCSRSIKHLPPDIARLRHLRTLRLTGQWRLTSLPSAIGQLNSLETLELSGCRLSNLPSEIGQLSNLRTLRVQDTCGLSQLPPEIERLASLSTLSLAGNRLTHLSFAIGQLENLVILDLASNELLDLPPDIARLHHLRHLDLSYNWLTRLPADLGRLSALETIHLEHNDLSTLPSEIGQLSSLECLTLDWNHLTRLPPQIGDLTRLLTLSLEHNQLTALPEELALLSRLEHLHLEHNRLSTIPPALTHLSYLHPLILDGNPLENIAPELLIRLTTLPGFAVGEYTNTAGTARIPQRVQYEEIWLDHDQFYLIDTGQSHYLPHVQADLTSTPIDIAFNQVALLSNRRQHYVWARLEFWEDEPPPPAGPWDLASDSEKTLYTTSGSLQFCDALSEKLSRNTFFLGDANKYYSLYVFCRGRAAAHEAVWNDGHSPRGHEQYLFQFWPYRPKAPQGFYSFVSLSSSHQVPEDPSPLPEDGKILAQMAARLNLDLSKIARKYKDGHLVELLLGSNQASPLHEFPPEILHFTHLSTLSLGWQQLTSLPPEIGHLTALESLYLGQNHLTDLPREIGLLVGLKSLCLNENRLAALPPEIGLLSSLGNLDLRRNQLSSLPPEIGHLTSLNSLNLDSNQLTRLPPTIGHLIHLKELHLNWNRLTSLPPEIGRLTSLAHLSLTRNPLESLPAEIGQLTNLRNLEVQESFALAYLPPEICSLKGLQTLDLGCNNLQYLPREIGHLLKLARLQLSGNWLQALPREIGQLPHLAQLNFSSNRLAELPREISQLSSLTSLSLDEHLLSSLPAHLRALITSLPPRQRKSISFETGPYRDAAGNVQTPRRVVSDEINVDYSQFLLQDAHNHLVCEQQGTVDNWINIQERGMCFISAAQYHYAWVRMEAWEHEPPPVPDSWDITSELTIIPHSGIVLLEELMGGSSTTLELIPGKEPGCTYRLRASCRGREALAEALMIDWEENDEGDEYDDPIPHGIEQYLLQFWPL